MVDEETKKTIENDQSFEVCKSCGNELKHDDSFCRKCGAKIQKNITKNKINIRNGLLIIFAIIGGILLISAVAGIILSTTAPLQDTISYEPVYDNNTSSVSEDTSYEETTTSEKLTYIGEDKGGKKYSVNENGMYYYSGNDMTIILGGSNGVTQFIGQADEYYLVEGDIVIISNGELTYKGP